MTFSGDPIALPQDPIPFRTVHELDRNILTSLIDSGGINFEAIGKTVGQFGRDSIFVDDGWIRWCASDLRVYRWPGPRLELENLIEIRRAVLGGRIG